MGWVNNSVGWIREKLNPAQVRIAQAEGTHIPSTTKIAYQQSFRNLEVVNRGVNMIVSAAASLDYDVKEKLYEGVVGGMRQKQLSTLLNYRPNPYQSTQEFRQAIFSDLILEGNVFIHYDGAFIYHLPSQYTEILTDPKTFIRGYRYNGYIEFKESEVFHFRDLSSQSIYRGASRLEAAQHSIDLLNSMHQFQTQFFDNGAVFGFVLTSDNTLSQAAKEKTIQYWLQRYSAKSGGKRPVILDSGLKPHSISNDSFKDLDFDQAVKTHNELLLHVLGVPPLLLAGGNNANISPNLRLFYLETVLPVVRKFISALERYYGYDVDAITSNVSALQPELKDIATYHQTLVNGGIITPNEARTELRYEKLSGYDDLRVPANIAGSAVNPAQGGRPTTPKE